MTVGEMLRLFRLMPPAKPFASSIRFHPSEYDVGVLWLRALYGTAPAEPRMQAFYGLDIRSDDTVIPGFYEICDQRGKVMSKHLFRRG